MKQFPRVGKDLQHLYEMIYLPMYTHVLFAGIELRIFSALREESTASAVAKKRQLHPVNTEQLLNALTAIGLVDKCEGRYQNSPTADTYLVEESELFVGDSLRVYSQIAGFEGVDLVRLVREGPQQKKQGLEAHSDYGDYTQMMLASQRIGRAKEIADLASSLPEFPRFKKMLDLGGGVGAIGIAILQEHESLQGVLFDTPFMIGKARAVIQDYEMEDRMQVLAGDYLQDSIGSDYDFIFASGTLNFAKHCLDKIMEKIYQALKPGGVFLCISDGLREEQTQPADMVISWLAGALQGKNLSLEQGEISNAMLRVGFQSVYKQSMCFTMMGELDVDIARKAK